jgi:hypothetical protein
MEREMAKRKERRWNLDDAANVQFKNLELGRKWVLWHVIAPFSSIAGFPPKICGIGVRGGFSSVMIIISYTRIS